MRTGRKQRSQVPTPIPTPTGDVSASREGFFAELKRRNVLRMAGLYLAAAWLVVEVTGTVLPMFGAPDWAPRSIVVVLLLGFVPALVFAWVFELTPDGIRRGEDVEVASSITQQTGRRMSHAIVALLILALGYFAFDKFMLAPRREAALVEATRSDDARSARAASAVADRKSIAVLPLVNAGGEQSEQFFSDGISEALIIALSQFPDLKVIARNSSFQFRDSKDSSAVIGQKLGVARLLSGSVQHADEMVRISLELVDASDGRAVWSQRYDRPYTDLFKLQDEITATVADALKARLLPAKAAVQSDRPPSGSLAAYNAFLEGNFKRLSLSADSDRQAIALYDRAIELDPGYGVAYAMRAIARIRAVNNTTLATAQAQAQAQAERVMARADARKAQVLAPHQADTNGAQGYVLEILDMDFAGAEAAYRRALALAPEASRPLGQLASILGGQGRLKQSVDMYRQALQRDPLSPVVQGNLGVTALGLGQLDEAAAILNKALELAPQNNSLRSLFVSIAVLRGDAAAAIRLAERVPHGFWRDYATTMALQIGRDRAAADAMLDKFIAQYQHDSSYQIADLYAVRGEPDKVFVWLDRAFAARDPGVTELWLSPFLTRYRDDPRFVAFCKKAGLPTPVEVDAANAAYAVEQARAK